MAHATQNSRSNELQATQTLPYLTRSVQDATRAAYIARLVSEAPPLSNEQIDRLAVILRPVIRKAAA